MDDDNDDGAAAVASFPLERCSDCASGSPRRHGHEAHCARDPHMSAVQGGAQPFDFRPFAFQEAAGAPPARLRAPAAALPAFAAAAALELDDVLFPPDAPAQSALPAQPVKPALAAQPAPAPPNPSASGLPRAAPQAPVPAAGPARAPRFGAVALEIASKHYHRAAVAAAEAATWHATATASLFIGAAIQVAIKGRDSTTQACATSRTSLWWGSTPLSQRLRRL